jgi:hypothetical protein
VSARLGGLRPTSDETTVQRRNGNVLISDGRLADIKAQVGCDGLIDHDDLDNAIEAAAPKRMIGSLPGAYPADALGPDPHDESGRRVVHRREPHIRPQIHVRQSLEEFGCATRLDPCPTVDDQILGEPVFVAASRLEREHDPGLAPHVVELLLGIAQVPGDDVLAVETDPDDRDLRRTVGVDGYEVSQMASGERRSGVFVEHDHCASLPRRHSAPMSSDQRTRSRTFSNHRGW